MWTNLSGSIIFLGQNPLLIYNRHVLGNACCPHTVMKHINGARAGLKARPSWMSVKPRREIVS